ncbi:YihY/virulence factor BrkB family protein [Halovivax limisalsi]|uniref:YihY/virulence factor BrkB family protein n=1 Tax=Halovivax limisalsi TaxID=1453760 RepID=UPI001FFD3863|nr:YihY/virulence factor BrkB family protein [Halovivax limisalsi]
MTDRVSVRSVLRETLSIARSRQLTLIAAGVAFYAFLSLVPIALLVIGVATSLGGDEFVRQLSLSVSDFLTPGAQQLLREALVEETGRRGATVVGAVGIIWGSSRVFRGLDRAFALVYETGLDRSLFDSFWDAAVVAGAITTGLVLVGVLEVVLLWTPLPVSGWLGSAFVLPALIVAFLPLYVVFPDADVSVRAALPGTVLAAVGWLVLSRSFAIYATVAAGSAIYGALGGVLLVLVWLYLGAIVVVFGATLNAVLAGAESDRQLQSPGYRQIDRAAMTEDATDRDDATRTPESPPDSDAAGPAIDGDRAGPTDGTDESRARPSEGAASARASRQSDRTRDRGDDPAVLREEIEQLRAELADLEAGVDERTVEREALEADLKRYVRRRVRRGHAHGWGPYLVLLYGTAMTIAAYYFLTSGAAILAMFVIWTSTLGVYLLMVIFGTAISALGLPGRLRDRIGEWRS